MSIHFAADEDPEDFCSYVPNQEKRLVRVKRANGIEPFSHGKVTKSEYFRLVSEHGLLPLDGGPTATSCFNCNACVPLRINSEKVNDQISRRQRRIMAKNVDRFPFRIKTGEYYSGPHHELCLDYCKNRHPESELANIGWLNFKSICMRTSHVFEMFDNEDEDRLVAFAWLNAHEDKITFDYLAYDIDLAINQKKGLGTYAWLAIIHLCQREGFKEMYCGTWVKDSRKLGYKKNFPGLETFVDGEWVDFDPDIHTEGPDYTATLEKLQKDGLEI